MSTTNERRSASLVFRLVQQLWMLSYCIELASYSLSQVTSLDEFHEDDWSGPFNGGFWKTQREIEFTIRLLIENCNTDGPVESLASLWQAIERVPECYQEANRKWTQQVHEEFIQEVSKAREKGQDHLCEWIWQDRRKEVSQNGESSPPNVRFDDELDIAKRQVAIVQKIIRDTVKPRIDAVREALSPKLQACHDMGLLLVFGTYWIDFDADEQMAVYRQVDFRQSVKERMVALTKEFPALDGLQLDLSIPNSGFASGILAVRIEEFSKRIEQALAEPNADLQYLDIVLCEDVNKISRHGKTVTMTRALLWQLLVILIRGRESYSPAAKLEKAWEDSCSYPPSDSTLKTAIGDLRKILEKLQVKLANKRQQGWRLEPMT